MAGAAPAAWRSRPGFGRRYTNVAIVLHWLIAALVLTNLYLGWRMGRLTGMAQFATFQLHKSVGISVLALSLLRLAWRLSHRPPPYPADQARWERAAATTVHWTFYALMIAMPLTGWIIVSASPLNIPTLLFKTIPFPHIAAIHDLAMPARKAIEDRVGLTHVVLAYGFAALIVLHVAAALKHQFVDRDHELARMMPGHRTARD